MIQRKEYLAYIKDNAPKTNEGKTLLCAFLVGGAICCIGQGVADAMRHFTGITDEKQLGTITSMVMIVFASILTGIGWYDVIGKHAGAGSIVPITGFANSIVSPAMEYSREGVIYGVMSRMFLIAGPVIVSGFCMSVVIGLIYRYLV